MVCFGKHVLVIKLSFYSGSFPNLAHNEKVILCRCRYHGDSVTMATDGNQFYSLALSTTETKTEEISLLLENICTKFDGD